MVTMKEIIVEDRCKTYYGPNADWMDNLARTVPYNLANIDDIRWR